MVLEYDEKYDDDIKDLLVELQEYIQNIDIEGYNILQKNYRKLYFEKVLNDVKNYKGKIFLYEEDNKIVGLVVGIVNNDEIETYDFKAPKRGRITELVISKNVRSKGIGTVLLKYMENYLKSIGCKDILIGVFAYNDNAVKFYRKNGYHVRMIDMINTDI